MKRIKKWILALPNKVVGIAMIVILNEVLSAIIGIHCGETVLYSLAVAAGVQFCCAWVIVAFMFLISED